MALTPTTDVRIRISATARAAQRTFDDLDRRLARPRLNMERLNLQFRRLDRVWTLIAVGSGAAIIKTFVGMASELQKTQLQLAAFTRDLDAVPQVMESVIALTERVPFTLNTMTNSFVRLKAAGIEPIIDSQGNGPLKDLADAVAAFGGGDEIFKRATIALQQMAGKGVISMEELRQQLGEAIPTAMRIMAEQMGISVSKLINDVSRGMVEFEEGADALFRGFREKFGGAGELLKTTFSGQLQQARLEFEKLSKALLIDTGALDFLTSALQQFNKQINDFTQFLGTSEGQEFIDRFWKGLQNVALFAAEASGPLMNLISIVTDLVTTISNVAGGLPAELVGGGILGFVLFGRAGAIPGALFGLFSDELAQVASKLGSFVQSVMGLLDGIGLNAAHLAAGGLIGFMLFGPIGSLIGLAIAAFNDVFSNVKKGIAVILLFFEEGIANLKAQFEAGISNPLDIIFNNDEIVKKGEEAGQKAREAFLRKLRAGETGLGDLDKNLFESLGIGLEQTAGAGDKAASALEKFFAKVNAGKDVIADNRKELVSMFQAIQDVGGLSPTELTALGKLGSVMERLREQATGGGTALGRFQSSLASDLGKIDGIIESVRERLAGMAANDTRIAGLRKELASLVNMRNEMAALGDTIVQKMGDRAIGGIEPRINRINDALDQFLTTGTEEAPLMEQQLDRVRSRFAGIQKSIIDLRQDVIDKTAADERQAEVLGTLDKLNEKLNAGLDEQLERTRALVQAQMEKTRIQAEARLQQSEAATAVLEMENQFDRVGLAVARAEEQVTRMTSRAEKEIAKISKQISQGLISEEAGNEMIARWRELMGKMAEEGDKLVERMRFNASDFGALMNNVASSLEDSLASGIENLVTKTKSAREILLDFYASITSAVARYLAQQALVGVFGGSQTGQQGGLGQILGQGLMSIFGGTPGLAQGGTMMLGGHGGQDNNVLALNGEPVARVSRGETMTIDPVGTSSRGEQYNISIQAVDAKGVRELFMKESSALVGALQSRQRVNRAN